MSEREFVCITCSSQLDGYVTDNSTRVAKRKPLFCMWTAVRDQLELLGYIRQPIRRKESVT